MTNTPQTFSGSFLEAQENLFKKYNAITENRDEVVAELEFDPLEHIDSIAKEDKTIPDSVIKAAKRIISALDKTFLLPAIGSSLHGGICIEWVESALFCELDEQSLKVHILTQNKSSFNENTETFDKKDLADGIAYILGKAPKKRDQFTLTDATKWLHQHFPKWTKAYYAGRWFDLREDTWYLEDSNKVIHSWKDITQARGAIYKIQFGDPEATVWEPPTSLDLFTIRKFVFGNCSGSRATERPRPKQDTQNQAQLSFREEKVEKIIELLQKYKLSGDHNILKDINIEINNLS